MKDSAYPKLLGFLKLLPKNDFTIYDDNEFIDEQEKEEVRRMNQMIDQGDFSEFEDHEIIKRDLHS